MKKLLNTVLGLVRKNAKAIVAALATLLAGWGLDLSLEVQAAIVTILVWLIPNKG